MKLQNKFKIYIISLLVVVVGGILLLFNGPTYAKYVSNSILNYNLKSKEFYLSSDFLDTMEAQNVNNLWDGASVHFNVKNSLNKSLITDYNINYTITCAVTGDAASYAECRMNGAQTNTYNGVLESVQVCRNTSSDGIIVDEYTKEECETGGYKWINVPVNTDLYFDVVLTKSGYTLSDVTVNVSLNSVSPYYKSLTGKFVLHKLNSDENQVTMNFKNYPSYNRLIITNSNATNKCVKISWNSSKLSIDADSTQYSSHTMDENNYINSIKLNVEAKKNVDFMFYSRNLEEVYSIGEFSIEESGGC